MIGSQKYNKELIFIPFDLKLYFKMTTYNMSEEDVLFHIIFIDCYINNTDYNIKHDNLLIMKQIIMIF